MGKLAIEGGKPVREKPMPGRIMFGEEEKKVVMELIEGGIKGTTEKFLDRYAGENVNKYEEEFAKFFGMKFATAVSSGTAAVHSAIAS
ncbi:MAG TPA: DegT/DnrJ/EryC1/StrS family aminotransferase, partial [Candidatus Ratteibacteria bacterium]|nr:DegT/DnrJ/EryC1/StrS family aminotransferase [Candidatus Ratteibacteria bacterium]